MLRMKRMELAPNSKHVTVTRLELPVKFHLILLQAGT